MKAIRAVSLLVLASLLSAPAWADEYDDTIALFKNAGQSAAFFDKSYGYAVFPTVGKAGLGVGGARGTGQVFRQGKRVGTTTMTQLSVGLQAGGKAFSQIIFFEDERAFNEFTSGNFQFGATVQATALTASAGASAGTSGSHATASGGRNDAATAGQFNRGMAVFTIAKGGLMYEASVAGQKFSYRPQE